MKKEEVLQAMKFANKPLNLGEVAKILDVDKSKITKIFAELKKDGSIISPVRCKWEPANK